MLWDNFCHFMFSKVHLTEYNSIWVLFVCDGAMNKPGKIAVNQETG